MNGLVDYCSVVREGGNKSFRNSLRYEFLRNSLRTGDFQWELDEHNDVCASETSFLSKKRTK